MWSSNPYLVGSVLRYVSSEVSSEFRSCALKLLPGSLMRTYIPTHVRAQSVLISAAVTKIRVA